MKLPGILAISVRGTAPLPAVLGDQGWHWGDDLMMDEGRGELDHDPGFERAERLIVEELVKEVLISKCGWEMRDIILFGFGQGGSLALGLASHVRSQPRVVDTESPQADPKAFKGAVSIGGPLPNSMVPTISSRQKSKTKVLVCQLDVEDVDGVKREFEDVKAVQWRRRELDMPRDREEMFPIMKFLADRLNSGW